MQKRGEEHETAQLTGRQIPGLASVYHLFIKVGACCTHERTRARQRAILRAGQVRFVVLLFLLMAATSRGSARLLAAIAISTGCHAAPPQPWAATMRPLWRLDCMQSCHKPAQGRGRGADATTRYTLLTAQRRCQRRW